MFCECAGPTRQPQYPFEAGLVAAKRTTSVSPYLRLPLRPLEEVESKRRTGGKPTPQPPKSTEIERPPAADRKGDKT